MRRQMLMVCVLLGLLGWPAMGTADVFINGVAVGNIAGTELKNCTVRFDSQGHVHITAPGYNALYPSTPPSAVKPPRPGALKAPGGHSSAKVYTPPPAAVGGTKPAPSAPPVNYAVASPLQGQYFLTTRSTRPGGVPYRFDVYINGKLTKKLTSDQAGYVMALNRHLVSGRNQMSILSYRQAGAPVGAAEDNFEIIIALGRGDGDTLMLEEILARTQRTASDTAPFEEKFSFQVR